MKQSSRFLTHTKSLWALFILGNAVITAPVKNTNEFTLLGFIIASVLGVIIYFALLPFAKKLFCQKSEIGSKGLLKILLCFIYLAVAVFSVFCAADTFLDFTKFIKDIVLKDTAEVFIKAIFLGLAVFFCLKRQEDTLKFFLISFWFALAVILVFSLAIAFKFDLKSIYISKFPDFKQIYLQTKPYLLNPVIPTILIPLYSAAVFGESRSSHSIFGCVLGYFLLGVCLLKSVLLFGPTLAGRIDYPYALAVSTISIGRLFARLDGFLYYIYFISSLAKITVSIFVASKSVERIKKLFD